MASGVYNIFKEHILEGSYALATDSCKVGLLNNSHTFDDVSTNAGWANVSTNEVSGTGYTAGGQAIANPTVTVDDTDNEGVFDGDDVTWSSSTITAFHAVVYDDTITTTPAADALICSIDFGGSQASSSGNFTIQWAAEGIINIT